MNNMLFFFQSARLCALVGPNVAAAAAEAAISALCDENPNAKEILDAIEVGMTEEDSTVLRSELPRSRLLNLFD